MLEAVEVELTLEVLSATAALAAVETAASQQILMLAEAQARLILEVVVVVALYLSQHPIQPPAA